MLPPCILCLCIPLHSDLLTLQTNASEMSGNIYRLIAQALAVKQVVWNKIFNGILCIVIAHIVDCVLHMSQSVNNKSHTMLYHHI